MSVSFCSAVASERIQFLSITIQFAPPTGPLGKLRKRNRLLQQKTCLIASGCHHLLTTVRPFYELLKKNTCASQHPRPKYVTLLYVPLSPKHHVSFPLFTERARTRATMYYRIRRSPFPFLKCRQVKRRRLDKPEKAIWEEGHHFPSWTNRHRR